MRAVVLSVRIIQLYRMQSEGANRPPIPNRSWLHSEPARLTLRVLRERRIRDNLRRNPETRHSSDSESETIASKHDFPYTGCDASLLTNRAIPRVQSNLEKVRRKLNAYYSSDSDSELPANVVIEREFPFSSFDESLFAKHEPDSVTANQKQIRPRVSRTPSNVSQRGEFSLTSYDSSIFDPNENNEDEIMSLMYTPPANATNDDIEREIEHLRHSIRNIDERVVLADVHEPPPNRETNTREQRRDPHILKEERRVDRQDTRAHAHDRDTRHTEHHTDRNEYAQILDVLNLLRADMNALNTRVARMENAETHAYDRRENDNDEYRMTYGRAANDARYQRNPTESYISLKEARGIIPEFNGTPHKLQEFLSACIYAVHNVDPAKEQSLVGAILCTKLKGKAMLDFQTRDIRTYTELKRQLELSYQSKRSTTHLQIEFNSLKQKSGESAQAFGTRVETLALELYESMVDGEGRSIIEKRTILDTIQGQALQNFQIGLRDEIQLIIRSRNYRTLQEAITAASAEERVKGTNAPRTNNYSNRNRHDQAPRQAKNAIHCYKCGKPGHYGRDCRSSKYALPKPEKSRVNSVEKFCKHCKKRGHNRDECWSLNGKPKPKTPNHAKRDNNDKK